MPLPMSKRARSNSIQSSAKRYRAAPAVRKRKSTGVNSISRFQTKRSTQEHKNYDVAVIGISCANNSPVFTLLNPLQQGSTSGTIQARNVNLTSILLNYTLLVSPSVNATTTTDIPATVRCMLIYDKQPTGAAPAVTDVLATTAFNAANNINEAGSRFIILYNEYHDMGLWNQGATTSVGATIVAPLRATVSKYIKIGLPFKGPSTAGSYTGIQEGALYFFPYSSGSTATTLVTCDLYTRVRFTDP